MKKLSILVLIGILSLNSVGLAAKKKSKVKRVVEKIESKIKGKKSEENIDTNTNANSNSNNSITTENEVKDKTEETNTNNENSKGKKKTVLGKIFKKDDKDSWQLVWSDEFNGDSLDLSKWSYWGDNNLPWSAGNYLDENGNLVDQSGFKVKHYYLKENVEEKDGNLILEVKKENGKTVDINGQRRRILYSSGAVHTKGKFSVQEGKIEMRAAMPKGVGTWPAFWLWPESYDSRNSSRPALGEIDIFEIYGSDLTKVTGTAHVLKADNTYKMFTGNSEKIRKNEDLTKFNTYAIEWNSDEIKWLFNGRVFKRRTMKQMEKEGGQNPFKEPYFIMINVALENKTGSDGDVDFPTEMKVDYVRVYKKK